MANGLVDSKVQIVVDELHRRQRLNPNYSMRAYSRDLGIDPGALSLILNGKRKLTASKAELIAARAKFDESKTKVLFGLNPRGAVIQRTMLASDKFSMIAGWCHFAILNFLSCFASGASRSLVRDKIIGEKLLIDRAINRLASLGMVEISTDGNIKRVCETIDTGDNIPSAAVKAFHKERLNHAQSIIDNMPPSDREFSSIFFAMAPSKFREFQLELRSLIDDLVDKYDEKSGKSQMTKAIYNFNVQVFPVSKEFQ